LCLCLSVIWCWCCWCCFWFWGLMLVRGDVGCCCWVYVVLGYWDTVTLMDCLEIENLGFEIGCCSCGCV
jgi:hypothetical protein